MAFWSRLFGFGMLDKEVQHPQYRPAAAEPPRRSESGPFIAAQLILGVLGLAGFPDTPWLFLTAGALLLLIDVALLLTGILNPLFPTVLYVGGWFLVGDWRGVLLGAIVGNLFDAGLTVFRRIFRGVFSRR